MPRYDLICPSGHRYSVTRSVTAPNPPCPECASTEVEIDWQAQAPGFSIKGYSAKNGYSGRRK